MLLSSFCTGVKQSQRFYASPGSHGEGVTRRLKSEAWAPACVLCNPPTAKRTLWSGEGRLNDGWRGLSGRDEEWAAILGPAGGGGRWTFLRGIDYSVQPGASRTWFLCRLLWHFPSFTTEWSMSSKSDRHCPNLKLPLSVFRLCRKCSTRREVWISTINFSSENRWGKSSPLIVSDRYWRM